MTNKKISVLLGLLVIGCNGAIEGETIEDGVAESKSDLDLEIDEIIANLEAADYPSSEIEVLTDGTVIVGGDAVVSLEASREIAGRRHVPEAFDGDTPDSFRQYRTTNLVGSGVTTICIVPTAAFNNNANLSNGLNTAIARYNAEGLSFTMQRNGSGCSATINANVSGTSGGSAGFPSGGLPYNTINIGSALSATNAAHVIAHELGHCIGFRHSDYYDRSISCGSGGNEGDAGVGAIHIPNTPTTAVYNGSVMNACYNGGSNGVWTPSDVIALDELYGAPTPPTGGSCLGSCGGSAGSCWCDDSCASFGDCCADKGQICDPGPNSCVEACGANAGACWCDASCISFGDCCVNKIEECGP